MIAAGMAHRNDTKAMFWEIITVAGATNDPILTEEDLAKGQSELLAELKESLLQPDCKQGRPPDTKGSPQLDIVMDLIARASVTIALHKQLPHEIIAEVFRLCLPLTARTVSFPPTDAQLLHAPWVLGQVCSSWRQLSQSIAELWDTITIRFDGLDTKKTLNTLRCASELLLYVALINVEVPDSQVIPVLQIKQYLAHISALDWRVKWSKGREIIERSSGSLSTLRSTIPTIQERNARGVFLENPLGFNT
ncbi:hypothetical protein H0H92_015899 [Tricholoma furcatifolium]|nr:hypothetical protein H0H92_015899 [Tricholoma furcatifolium]